MSRAAHRRLWRVDGWLAPAALVLFVLLSAGVADAQAPREPLPRAARGVRALAAGGAHTCAVLAAGTVACWGLNTDGQLARGETLGTPAPIAGVRGATAIAAGQGHTCAVIVDAKVLCWGSNSRGQLGRRATERERSFPTPSVVGEISDAIGVAVGRDHSCALLRDGRVMCWGGNSSGQLGDGTTTDSAAPIPVLDITSAVALAA
jgi:alpha-tubulin suppressor-like RCC1 family protein